jgi:hypothetical protein
MVPVVIFKDKGNVNDDDNDNSLSPRSSKNFHVDITDNKDLTLILLT